MVRVEPPGLKVLPIDLRANRRILDTIRLETEPCMTFLQKRSRSAPDFDDLQWSGLEIMSETPPKVFIGVTASDVKQPSTKRRGRSRWSYNRFPVAMHRVPIGLIGEPFRQVARFWIILADDLIPVEMGIRFTHQAPPGWAL